MIFFKMFDMYTRLTHSKKARHPVLQIVKGVRHGKKVKQQIVASLGVIKDQKDLLKFSKLAENLIQKLEQHGFPKDNRVVVQDLIHKLTTYDGFGLVVNRLMEISGFSKILREAQGKNSFNLEEIVKLILIQRLDLPSSKLRTYERQTEHGFHGVDLQHLYRAMDVIEPFSSLIQQKAFETVSTFSPNLVDCFFFDVTTLYFESVTQDEIRDFGFSKDQKHHSVQIVLALVVDSEGNPLAYETFKGNLSETKTLLPVLESLRSRFAINNVTVVCDRGLASKPNVDALRESGFHFVIATKLRSIAKKWKINDRSSYSPLPSQAHLPEEERVLFRVMEHPQYPDTTLIATYSPSRAIKDKADRERLLEKLQKKLGTTSNETSIKKVISNGGYKKYTTVKAGSLVTLNQKTVDEDATWDGFHGIAVSNSAKLGIEQALCRYRELWHVEETFRIAKSTLKTRPIFHWKTQRIKAHVLLCFMTLFIERFLEFRLRQGGTPLTPDRIRHALAGVHTMFFEQKGTDKSGKMESMLSEDAEKIFKILEIPLERATSLTPCCV
jgi:transposase